MSVKRFAIGLAVALTAGFVLTAPVSAMGRTAQEMSEPAPSQEQTGQEQSGQEAQEGEMGAPDAQAGLPADDSDSQDPEVMSDREEEALRLVAQILEDQRGIVAGQNFIYRSQGRRDPFRNLLQLRQREIVAPTQRPPGLAGFLVGEIQVTAVAMFQGRWHALLIGLDNRTYTATVGTEMYDGRIVEINHNEVVFEQEVEDLIGARSTRRVVKTLNTGNE